MDKMRISRREPRHLINHPVATLGKPRFERRPSGTALARKGKLGHYRDRGGRECADFYAGAAQRARIRPISGSGLFFRFSTARDGLSSLRLGSADWDWVPCFYDQRRFFSTLWLPSVFCWGPLGCAAFVLKGMRGRGTSATKQSRQ
jgi:hypothetical protein